MKPNEVKDTIVKAFMDFYEINNVDQNTPEYHDSVTNFVDRVEAAVDALKPEPVVVSEEEATMLDRAKNSNIRVTKMIYEYVTKWLKTYPNQSTAGKTEERLLRAYVNGYMIQKERKWAVKVPKTDHWYVKDMAGHLNIINNMNFKDPNFWKHNGKCYIPTFTADELHKHGFDGDEFLKVWVDDDD